jgi:hypothetical protein
MSLLLLIPLYLLLRGYARVQPAAARQAILVFDLRQPRGQRAR